MITIERLPSGRYRLSKGDESYILGPVPGREHWGMFPEGGEDNADNTLYECEGETEIIGRMVVDLYR